MDTRIKVRIETIRYGTWENLQVAFDINSVKDLYLTFPTIEVILNYPYNSVRKKLASESLKAFLGRSLSEGKIQGEITNIKAKGSASKVNLLGFSDFIALATWEASINGNVEVAKILAIGFADSFRDMALRQLGVHLSDEERDNWIKARMNGKVARRTLTDSIKDWIDRNGTSCPSHFMYATCTNQIYQALWHMNADELREHYNVGKGGQLRDAMEPKVLSQLERAEGAVMEVIDEDNLHPTKEAVESCRIRYRLIGTGRDIPA